MSAVIFWNTPPAAANARSTATAPGRGSKVVRHHLRSMRMTASTAPTARKNTSGLPFQGLTGRAYQAAGAASIPGAREGGR